MPLALLLLASSACNVTKRLYEDEVLITKNKISGIDKSHRDEMQPLLRPRPNRKFLGIFRAKAWFNVSATRGQQSRLQHALNSSFGEPPALLDSASLREGQANLQAYLLDKGYFYGKVSATVQRSSRNPKKARIIYQIEPGPRYQLNNIHYELTHSQIDEFVFFHMYESREFGLRPGIPFDADQLSRTRARISTYLREMGFFYFNRELIYFEIDSTLGNHRVDVNIRIKRPKEPFYFEQFSFDSIIVNVDFQAFQQQADTLLRDTIERSQYYFIDRVPPSIRKDILVQNMLFRTDLIFSESAMRLTQSRIADLKVFGYNNIRLIPNDSTRKLNVLVNLTPSKKRQLKLDSEVSTNSISLFGIAGSITEVRRNVLGGGELLEFRLNAGVESQQNVTATDVLSRTTFNTLEYGIGTSLTIPRFLFPFRHWNERFYTAPRTRFGISYNRQIRLDFTREILQANLGYLWMNRARERFEFFPAEVSLARTARVSQNLSNLITELNDPFLQFSFTNYINLASRMAYSVDNLSRRGTFMRVNLEFAGNSLHALYNLLDIQTDTVPRRLLNLPYFQYTRADVEYRKYWKQSDVTTLASRIFVGVGLPLQNSIIMPLEKTLFRRRNQQHPGLAGTLPGAGCLWQLWIASSRPIW
jgi:outer membrane protein insertion porin family